MRQSLLAKRENKVSTESTVLMKAEKIARAAREKATRSPINRKMKRVTRIATDSSTLRKRRSVEETAEVVAVDAEAVEASIVMMIMSTAEEEIDPKLIMQRKDLTRPILLKSRPLLLHRRRKKLRSQFPPRNSLAGTLYLFNENSEIK